MSDKDKLTHKQRLFVLNYMGNGTGTDAAVKAGYSPKSAMVQASRLLSYAKIKSAVEKIQGKVEQKLVADRAERLKFWSDTMRSPNAETRDRISASHLLGKAEGDFVEKIEHSGTVRHVHVAEIADHNAMQGAIGSAQREDPLMLGVGSRRSKDEDEEP